MRILRKCVFRSHSASSSRPLQIKSKQSSLIWCWKVPRLSQTQWWFTEKYSVDNVTQADI